MIVMAEHFMNLADGTMVLRVSEKKFLIRVNGENKNYNRILKRECAGIKGEYKKCIDMLEANYHRALKTFGPPTEVHLDL